jgi:hypothetical protein
LRYQNSEMGNAPFRFFPDDWLTFFAGVGWEVRELRYYSEESRKHGRRVPMKWLARSLTALPSKHRRQTISRMLGFALLTSGRPPGHS